MRAYRQRDGGGPGFPRPEGMPAPLHRLLERRGIASQEEAERFLHPGVRDLNDPFLLSNMEAAVAALRRALEAGNPIVVYGDYDVDGVSASAILFLHLRSLGARVEVYLPSRHSEGYGLNEDAVRKLAERCALMVTVDCGITSADLVELAKSLGMSVVVTDHHRPGDALPDCPVVDPLLEGYPCPALCGAGVAFQLVAALSGREAALQYVDLAALATVADVVSLTGENRAIVRLGLDAMAERPRPGITALIEAAGLEGRVLRSGNIAFQLAPRLNAGGRLGSAARSLNLLTESDPERARGLALELDAENTARKELEQKIISDALTQLEDFDFPAHRAIVLMGEDWNPGVIGLAASRLVERFHYPTILLAAQGDNCVGSCRSIEGVDIHAALTAVKHYFLRFGGHRQAAGLTIPRASVPAFARDLDAHLFAAIPPEAYIPVEEYDLEVDFSELGDLSVESLEALQPTGMGNPAPVFRARAQVREARTAGRDGAHLKLRLLQGETLMDAMFWREGRLAPEISGEQDLLFTPSLNTYLGRTTVQLNLEALSPGEPRARLPKNPREEGKLLRRFLTDILYNSAYSDLSPAGTLSPQDLEKRLREGVQGTLIAAGSPEAAARLLDALGDVPLDLTLGRWPEDPRAFNTLAVCPVGPPPRGYSRVVLADLPLGPEGAEALILPPGSWRRELPGLEALRETYKALRRLLSRPLYAPTLEGIALALSQEAGQSELTALAGLLALADMGLANLTLHGERASLSLAPSRKTDPAESPVYRRICAFRVKPE